jgi:hypothetical protein
MFGETILNPEHSGSPKLTPSVGEAEKGIIANADIHLSILFIA